MTSPGRHRPGGIRVEGWRVVLAAAAVALPSVTAARPPGTVSHPAIRPLPAPSRTPAADGRVHHVDGARGDDRGDGSVEAPWRSIGHALQRIRPGATLCLRDGVYRERLVVGISATAARPVTIRSHPNELAILDGGYAEFLESPATAWEPAGGVPGEYRSTATYPALAARRAEGGARVLGNFADSMVPLHAYRYAVDLRAGNEFWNLESKESTEAGVYLGPGLWLDAASGRIHLRLAPLESAAWGEARYRGETDPRRLPLVVSGPDSPLRIEGASHLRLIDLMVRGAAGATVVIRRSRDVTLDGVTVYGGSPALEVESTRRLTIVRSALRGLSTPWSSRAGHKYRGAAPYLAIFGAGNREVEIAWSELTDSHDGLDLGRVLGLDFHHNLVDNFDDDAIYLTAHASGGDLRLFQNRFSRALSTLSFWGSWAPGRGVLVYRNVFDLRRPSFGAPPPRPEAESPLLRSSRLWGDHGSPVWEPLRIYHNTAILPATQGRAYYAGGWGSHTRGTIRRIFNNLFVHLSGPPGLFIADLEDDLVVDGNLHWSLAPGPGFASDFFAAFRRSLGPTAGRDRYPPGLATSDLFADPRLASLPADWRRPLDPRPRPGSPVIDAGVPIPRRWPDPLRARDPGPPDLGAVPYGIEPDPVGIAKRP